MKKGTHTLTHIYTHTHTHIHRLTDRYGGTGLVWEKRKERKIKVHT